MKIVTCQISGSVEKIKTGTRQTSSSSTQNETRNSPKIGFRHKNRKSDFLPWISQSASFTSYERSCISAINNCFLDYSCRQPSFLLTENYVIKFKTSQQEKNRHGLIWHSVWLSICSEIVFIIFSSQLILLSSFFSYSIF